MREHGDAHSEPVTQPDRLPSDPAAGIPDPLVATRAPTAAQVLLALPPPAAGAEARGARALARAVRVRTAAAPQRRLARIFERADASNDPAGAKAAIKEYDALTPAARVAELTAHYPTGKLAASLNQLGKTASGARAPAFDADIAGVVMRILRWVEETATRAYTGKTDAELAALQETFLKAKAAVHTPAPAGYGGVPDSRTRWTGLTAPERPAWTARGRAAITTMAAYCQSHNPELNVTERSFELDFAGVDKAALGAIATTGSVPGKKIQVGFEFVVAVEMDPKYALSTVVHELYGHPSYDRGVDENYSRALYQKSIAAIPGRTIRDRSGQQTYAYWPSEIYSLVKEFHYFTPVSTADKAKSVALPDKTTTMDHINYPPTGGAGVKRHLRTMKSNWDPIVLEGLLRGLYERLRHDPSIYVDSLNAYKTAVGEELGTAVADKISK